MSERYGTCRHCGGSGLIGKERQVGTWKIIDVECGLCGGTGFDGGVDRLQEKEAKLDEELYVQETD